MHDVAKEINAKNKSVLIIGDTHLPYEHIDYIDFIIEANKKYKCEIHIHVGDETDGHAISFHDSDVDLLSAGKELELAISNLKLWNKAFPKLILLESNHGSLLFRRMKANGIPIRVLKTLQQIYDTPKWSWWHDVIINTNHGPIYGCHGKKSGYGGLAKEQGCSSFQGHYHGKFEITWHERIGHKQFNMFVGCGINWKSLAFAYGKNNLPKPILGCGIIDEDGIPHLIKMKLTKKGRWAGKI